MKRRGILDVKPRTKQATRITILTFSDGGTRVIGHLPGAVEPLVVEAPNDRYWATSRFYNRLREMHIRTCEAKEYTRDFPMKKGEEVAVTFGYQESTPFTGVCCVCGQHIGMGVTVQWNKVREGDRWVTRSIQCLKHRYD